MNNYPLPVFHLLFFCISMWFVEKDNRGVPCVDGGGMDDAFGEVEPVAFGVARCRMIKMEVDDTF